MEEEVLALLHQQCTDSGNNGGRGTCTFWCFHLFWARPRARVIAMSTCLRVRMWLADTEIFTTSK